MSYKVRFTLSAEQDLSDIASYLYEQSKDLEGTLQYLSELRSSVRRLSEYPRSGLCPHNRILLNMGFRFFINGNYLLFYKTDDIKQEIIVSAVLNGNQDYVKIMRNRI